MSDSEAKRKRSQSDDEADNDEDLTVTKRTKAEEIGEKILDTTKECVTEQNDSNEVEQVGEHVGIKDESKTETTTAEAQKPATDQTTESKPNAAKKAASEGANAASQNPTHEAPKPSGTTRLWGQKVLAFLRISMDNVYSQGRAVTGSSVYTFFQVSFRHECIPFSSDILLANYILYCVFCRVWQVWGCFQCT